MNAKSIALIVGILAILIACEEQPTAVTEVDGIEPQLIQTDKGNREEIEWLRLDWTDYWTDLPCVSEPLMCQGTTYAWGKEHTPPAGDNSTLNMKFTYSEDTHCIGEDSGVRWSLVKQSSSGHFLTKRSDGLEYWRANSIEQYETADGDKLHMRSNWWYVWDPFPNLVSVRWTFTCGPRA
jgi:hypothetical protein